MQQVNPGFQQERMLTVQLFLPRSKYTEKQQVISFLGGVIDHVGSIAGVEGVAAVSTIPLSGRAPINTQLISILTAVVLIVTAVGIYGVVSYSVSHRTHEIGIRMALGAQPADILRMIIAQGFKLALAGTAIGLAGAFALTRLIDSLLYNVSSADPLTFITMSLIMVGVVIAASCVPARRATRTGL
ncbi:MAG TPA: FtsX-like permease family protein [Pyrinomonadaceae bacterium]|nr:FtsX-like permease family protein [Pyrinomonadaceae bacterium]